MTIQEYLEKAVPQTIITDGVHTVGVDITKNNRDLYENGIRLGMEFAEWLRRLNYIIDGGIFSDAKWYRWKDYTWVDEGNTEQLFELFLTEKFK